MNMDRLYADVKKKGPVCVGLDTVPKYLPRCLAESGLPVAEQVLAFNRRVIDAVTDDAGCFKVQIACYEALGLAGLRTFCSTVQYARERGAVVISDVKRGDISSTAEQYARAHFTGDMETDLLTLNAYMGEDAVSPYYPYFREGKGAFVLVKTSNPSGRDFQDLLCGEKPLYLRMAEKVSAWGEAFIGKSGFSAIGAVTGCTYPEEFLAIRHAMPHTFFLIPGYGAQGGTGRDVAAFFRDGVCGVVNSSRGLLLAYRGKTEGSDYDAYIHDAVRAMRKGIEAWL